jgi:hypothetical protein
MSGEARAEAGDILWAGYSDATDRYRHGVLGDAIEAGGLRVATEDMGPCDLFFVLPDHLVFEDVAPRIVDLEGDGTNEVIVVESHAAAGAALSVFGLRDGVLTRLASTQYIGATHRWLAPVGAADLNGDGIMELAYVDRPHLARILRVVEWKDGRLREIAAASGVTNHRIGESDIAGGIRDCGEGPEMIVADAGWEAVMAVKLQGRQLAAKRLFPHEGRASFARAMACAGG